MDLRQHDTASLRALGISMGPAKKLLNMLLHMPCAKDDPPPRRLSPDPISPPASPTNSNTPSLLSPSAKLSLTVLKPAALRPAAGGQPQVSPRNTAQTRVVAAGVKMTALLVGRPPPKQPLLHHASTLHCCSPTLCAQAKQLSAKELTDLLVGRVLGKVHKLSDLTIPLSEPCCDPSFRATLRDALRQFDGSLSRTHQPVHVLIEAVQLIEQPP